MFLDKPEDIAFFNKIMEQNPTLEPYFAELGVYAWIYHRERYLELIQECKGTNETFQEAMENMVISPFIKEEI